MNTIIVAALLVSNQSSPSEVVSKMFQRYATAEQLTASVRMTLKAENDSLVVDSALQYQRPNKLYLKQDARYKNGKSVTVIADGKVFTYDMPENVAKFKGQRASEPQGELKLDAVYAVSVGAQVDKSPAIDILIARREHLEFLTKQWASMGFADEDSPNSVLVGSWREYGKAIPTGTYRLEVTPQGDLLNYSITEKVALPNTNRVIDVTTRWDVIAEVGKLKDESLFKIVVRN